MAAAAIFVICCTLFAWLTETTVQLDAARLAAPLLPVAPPDRTAIPVLYLDPDNVVMWTLMVAICAMVLLDAVGQWIDDTDREPVRTGRRRVWPFITAAALLAATWPALITLPLLLTAVTTASAVLATVGARHAAGRHRPAIGFFAGWATALASSALAEMSVQLLSLPQIAVPAVAILPAAALGMAAQMWIGTSIGYSVALIWAFCGLAISTMGTDPMIALVAIIGISAMAAVLIRAAS
ncbi:hypothetical protein [Paracoccus sp. ME4]|uniref:hypothetical protein n=1 Tax=Paracoccus sp. ME4 TaxID=3138066 RepID=UPI00398B7E02